MGNESNTHNFGQNPTSYGKSVVRMDTLNLAFYFGILFALFILRAISLFPSFFSLYKICVSALILVCPALFPLYFLFLSLMIRETEKSKQP